MAGADTDDGFGGGARAELARLAEGYAPYKWAVVVHLYTTTTGFHHHRLAWDRTGWGPRGRLRLTARLAWRQWLNDGYWGIGNGTLRAVNADKERYQYALYQPFLHVTARQSLSDDGPWQAFAAVSPRYSVVEAEPGSLLAAEQPFGIQGGPTVQLYAGALHDSRAPEIAPERGHLLELSGRIAPDLGGEAGGFGGGLASARVFAAAGDRVVLAGRVMGEWLVGQVPFYEMVHWGGAIPVAGFGGAETLRGVSFGRWRAPGKAIANVELRWRVHERTLGKGDLALELAPWADAGMVFGGGRVEEGTWPVHPSAGLGLRPILDETFVGRVDAGFGVDDVIVEGRVRQVANFGFYLAFDHPF